MAPQAQTMAHAHAFVKNKTLAFPDALLRRDLFQVLEDAAFKVVNLVKAAHLHQGS